MTPATATTEPINERTVGRSPSNFITIEILVMATKTKSKLNLRPLADRVIIQRAEAEEMTAGGILLPESAKDKPKEGQIIALGDGLLNKETGEYMPFTVKKGDLVIFTSYAGTEIKIDGEELLIMTEDDILGVVE